MKLEVGKSYKTRGGWKATIVCDDFSNVPFKVLHKERYHMWHFKDGSENSCQDQHDLVAEWQDEVDLTKITTPFGLLDKETQERLKAHGGPYEYYWDDKWVYSLVAPNSADGHWTFRVKPRPTVEYKRVTDAFMSKHTGFTYTITEKFVDGKYDSYTVDMVPF